MNAARIGLDLYLRQQLLQEVTGIRKALERLGELVEETRTWGARLALLVALYGGGIGLHMTSEQVSDLLVALIRKLLAGH